MVEPFYSGSHKHWMDDYKKHSHHEVSFLTLPGRYWKWRMHGGAVTLAGHYNELKDKPDVIIVSDFLDLAVFKSLLADQLYEIPIYLYFHENQISYPWSPDDKDVRLNRDRHYGFINYTSALVADYVIFNSYYHQASFLDGLDSFLRPYPDFQNLKTIEDIRKKSDVLYLGLDLKVLDLSDDTKYIKPKWPVILWNHRWEYDKNPEQFFNALEELKDRGIKFRLILLGAKTSKWPDVFDEAKISFKDEILHWGYCENKADYAKWLWMADILPVTSIQEYFGISVIEAVYCNTIPLLPLRLSYPEHFKAAHQRRQFFYNDQRDLVNRLQRYCMDVSILRKQNTQKIVEHYDWTYMSHQYDQLFNIIKLKN